MNIKRLPPKNDFIFQRIFGRQENKEILISFLNAVLDKPGKGRIKDIIIIDNTKLENRTQYQGGCTGGVENERPGYSKSRGSAGMAELR